MKKAGALAMGLAGVGMWAGASLQWFRVDYFDDRAGAGTAMVRGTEWSTEISAVALLLLAGMIAVFALRRLGRRVVGGIALLAAAGGAVSALLTLTNEVDPERMHALLSAGSENAANVNQESVIAAWAEITGIQLLSAGPVIALVAALIGVVGAGVVVFRPGVDSVKRNRFETEAVRRAKIREDLASQPDSGRVMWDALDSDIDPTDNR